MDIHIDFETRSSVDIAKCGAYRYAQEAEILMMGVALGDGAPTIYFPGDELPGEIYDGGNRLWAHNAQFEVAVSQQCWRTAFGGAAPALDRWNCTAVLARKAGLSSHLGTVARQLHLTHQKDTRGAALIRRFCIPPYTEKEEDLEGWGDFVDYCLMDVATEQEIHQTLRQFELSLFEERAFRLDQRVNHRGFPVNRGMLDTIQAEVHGIKRRAADWFFKTYGVKITQRAKVLELLKEMGYKEKGLTAKERQAAIVSPATHYGVVDLLRKYGEASFTALNKLDAMDRWVCEDGNVKGTHQFFGAGTGRWSSKGVQVQNMKRSTAESEKTYDAVRGGADLPESTELISQMVRHLVQPQSGGFLDVDYASIEARVCAWIAGEAGLLKAFEDGTDIYVRMAEKIFPDCHVIGKPERAVGKVAALAAQYGQGPKGYKASCDAFGIPMTLKAAGAVIAAYRDLHPSIVKFWSSCETWLRKAVLSHGDAFGPPHLRFRVTRAGGYDYGVITLPSGRSVYYPGIVLADERQSLKYMDANHVPGNSYNRSSGWDGMKNLYGGLICENIVQAIAFDLLAHGAVNAERKGFEVVALIHDEVLVPAPDEERLPELIEALTELPNWAAGLPLEADGTHVPYYTKT